MHRKVNWPTLAARYYDADTNGTDLHILAKYILADALPVRKR